MTWELTLLMFGQIEGVAPKESCVLNCQVVGYHVPGGATAKEGFLVVPVAQKKLRPNIKVLTRAHQSTTLAKPPSYSFRMF